MKKDIKNPYKVNKKMYSILLFVFSLTLIFSYVLVSPLLLKYCKSLKPIIHSISDLIKNISFGCIASIIVAWLIDESNVKKENIRANQIYDAVYRDLKYSIQAYIETWAEMFKIAFKEDENCKEGKTWFEWYELTKNNATKYDYERQKELKNFFKPILKERVSNVKESVNNLLDKYQELLINNIINDELKNIIKDFQFEFTAAEYYLNTKQTEMDFWRYFDAINKDLKNYIDNWTDIKYYNLLEFNPWELNNNLVELLKASIKTENEK